ncbi:MAG TPA: right-handed parallel beta-helix repeat-containing protein [Solirubrobacterales bacterium]|nr:right-handed parallel beta-helix repeat-containing protein [Solirubrobacterales bacterium]
MTTRPRVALTLLAALFILALPATASAALYTVDSTGDEADATPGVGGCLTAALKCTLRAAIEESNESESVADEIKFTIAFDGEVGSDTIALGSTLPTIDDPVTIEGGSCSHGGGVNGPCVGVSGPVAGFSLQVDSDNVTIRGLAVTGALVGINVINESENFVAQGNWLGVKLDSSASANAIGIFVDPGSDLATIGGTAAGAGNVFGNNTQGLDLQGASGAQIQGNYFGVAPDGVTSAPNNEDLEITDSTAGGGFAAEGNEIGATVSESAAATADCDGGCNVISGSLSTGIDLNGESLEEKPATGPTIVHGNFVGLDATGTGVVANTTIGIWVGGADDVRVGAPLFVAPDPERNYIAGGLQGIAAETGGNGFEARANSIGFGSDESEQTPPTGVGIFVLGSGVTEESEIESNAIRMTGTAGIEVRDITGRIIGNEIQGGNSGIVAGFGQGEGLIASNEVDASGEFGILIESAKNDVRDNIVTNSNGPGIAVKPPNGVTATIGNVIGGSSTGTENVIDGSAGPAIQIVEEAGEPGSWTEITRNRGASNGGLFIDLVTGANQGILPPAISSATQTKAAGTAKPNATVRLFRKATAGAGEVEAFLAETEADGSGNWAVAYSSIPAGTNLAATQTVIESGTSELALTTAAADPSGGGTGNGGGGNNGGGGGTPDTIAPTVKITKAPKAKSTSTTAKFKFKANEAGSTFQCKLDKGKFKNCRSPKTYKKLKPGKHVFKVRATDKAGNVGKAAKKRFTVLL